jgi:hypothetical protein
MSDDRMKLVQQQATEVTALTRANIQQSLNNMERLETMETKADQLQHHAHDFHRGAVKLRRRFCWENYRLIFILLIVLAIIGVIIYGIVEAMKNK